MPALHQPGITCALIHLIPVCPFVSLPLSLCFSLSSPLYNLHHDTSSSEISFPHSHWWNDSTALNVYMNTVQYTMNEQSIRSWQYSQRMNCITGWSAVAVRLINWHCDTGKLKWAIFQTSQDKCIFDHACCCSTDSAQIRKLTSWLVVLLTHFWLDQNCPWLWVMKLQHRSAGWEFTHWRLLYRNELE